MTTIITNANQTARYAPCAEVAKWVRAALKASFPGVKFSVRSDRSVRISWVDGPTQEEVQKVTYRFEGSSFDGSTDSKTTNRAFLHDGELVYSGADYVLPSRSLSVEFLGRIAEQEATRFGYPVPEVTAEYGYSVLSRSCDRNVNGWNLYDQIMRTANSTSAYTAPVKPEQPAKTDRAARVAPTVETQPETSEAAAEERAETLTTISDAGEPVTYTVLTSGTWVWVKFSAMPAEPVRVALSAAEFHWSRKRSAWYRTSELEREAVLDAITTATYRAQAQR